MEISAQRKSFTGTCRFRLIAPSRPCAEGVCDPHKELQEGHRSTGDARRRIPVDYRKRGARPWKHGRGGGEEFWRCTFFRCLKNALGDNGPDGALGAGIIYIPTVCVVTIPSSISLQFVWLLFHPVYPYSLCGYYSIPYNLAPVVVTIPSLVTLLL